VVHGGFLKTSDFDLVIALPKSSGSDFLRAVLILTSEVWCYEKKKSEVREIAVVHGGFLKTSDFDLGIALPKSSGSDFLRAVLILTSEVWCHVKRNQKSGKLQWYMVVSSRLRISTWA